MVESNLCWLLERGAAAAPVAADVCLLSYSTCRPLLYEALRELLDARGLEPLEYGDVRPGRVYEAVLERVSDRVRESSVGRLSRSAAESRAAETAMGILFAALVAVMETIGVRCGGPKVAAGGVVHPKHAG